MISCDRGIVAEKPSESLFTFDTTGSEEIRKTHKSSKPLKADQILAARSAIPAVSNHKRLGVTDGIIEPSSKRRRGNGVTLKEYERLKRIAYGGESVRKDVVETEGGATHDPWAPSSTSTEDKDPQFSYLEKPRSIRPPSTLQKAPVSLLASNSSLPAVPKPKPGISYNPVFQDWDALLTSAGAAEVAAERKRRTDAVAEAEKQMFIAAAQNERENDEYKTEDESAWEGFESENEVAAWLKKKRPERKTPTERNKVNRRKEAERRAKWEAQMKKRDKQAKQLGSIAKEVEREAKARAMVIRKEGIGGSSEDEGDAQVLRRRKLGKHKYVLNFLLLIPSPLNLC